jgi:hypothetical protein
MAISRTYSAGWGFAETLTSAQLNAVDNNAPNLLDKRIGYGDTLGSSVQATGSGRIVSSVQTGPDADTTFHVWGHNAIVRVPTLTAARRYTLGHSGATGGDRMLFYVEGTGSTASGYADVANNVGTGLFRLGWSQGYQSPTGLPGHSLFSEGDACEVTFNGTGWVLLNGAGPGLRSREFTSITATEWVCPPGVHSVLLYGYGGGGGGAAGATGTHQTSHITGGGGGGGGSLARTVRVPVVPSRSYEALAGAGGSGGFAPHQPGQPGGDSIFREKASGNVLATFRGADFGTTAAFILTSGTGTSPQTFGFGGGPVRLPTSIDRTFITGTNIAHEILHDVALMLSLIRTPGSGGAGVGANVATTYQLAGLPSLEGFAGGATPTRGTPTGGYWPGGPGGGGGAGPGGVGGGGGSGGASIGVTSGILIELGGTGIAGITAAMGSGAGGGGGGGGGNAAAGRGGFGAGGAGGSGKIILMRI